MQDNFRKPNAEETELKRIALTEAESARAQLLVKQPFIGMLAMRMELVTVVDSRLPTASTDGSKIYFSAPFLMSLENEKRIFLMAHELWHCVFLHFQRKGNRDHDRFNYAADLEVNFMLKEQGFITLENLPHKKKWKGLSAEAIYDLLDGKQQRPDSADVHIYDKDLDEIQPSGQDSESGTVSQWIKDDDYQPMIETRTERKWRQWVVSAAQQVKRSKGDLPDYLKQVIKDQYQPELGWKEILQQFVSYCFGGSRQWLPPNRRYISQQLYLPSRKDDFLSVVIAIDTSGSTMYDLPGFLAELKGIVTSFGRYDVTMIECDATVQNVRHFSEWEPFEYEKFRFHGFGGTDFRPVFTYIQENIPDPKLLIFMTDGYGDVPSNPPEYPVLWVLTSDGTPPAGWGWKAWLTKKPIS
jgi:predicted metal-dependent peptidase